MNTTTMRATILFAATSVIAAIVVGAMLVSGWGGGILDKRIEWIYWAGAIFAAFGIGLFGIASVVSERRSDSLTRVGMALFLAGPVLASSPCSPITGSEREGVQHV